MKCQLKIGRPFVSYLRSILNESDRLAIIDGLKDGTIDAVTSDHTPQDQDVKDYL